MSITYKINLIFKDKLTDFREFSRNSDKSKNNGQPSIDILLSEEHTYIFGTSPELSKAVPIEATNSSYSYFQIIGADFIRGRKREGVTYFELYAENGLANLTYNPLYVEVKNSQNGTYLLDENSEITLYLKLKGGKQKTPIPLSISWVKQPQTQPQT